MENIFNFVLNAKKLHYGKERYKQIESDSCGTKTYSKRIDRTSKTLPCNCIEMVYQYLAVIFGTLRQVASELENKEFFILQNDKITP